MEGEYETEFSVYTNQRNIDWKQVNWTQIKERVKNLQQKIFHYAQTNNYRKLRQYQKLLVRSLSARLWAVRLVTEINRGKYTPGIDGCIVKNATEKVNLAESLKIKNYKSDPVKVRWIPKANGTKRKLGIPTIRDRAMQALIMLVMDPEWESRFEPHSFGFRPGRNAIDAVSHIATVLMNRKGRISHAHWVFDADITSCFDNIKHESLLTKIQYFPFHRIIRKWLKSGAITRIGFEKSRRGTPQGGVISPLLANIALDGLERIFNIYTRSGNYIPPSHRSGQNKHIALFRYADDFIVLAPSKEILIKYVIPKIKDFLSLIGLELNDAKTQVRNVSEGFNFLGFTFRRFFYQNGNIKKFTYYPNKKRLNRFLESLKDYIKRNWNIDIKVLIKALNTRIIGFCNYYRWSNAHKAFIYLSWRIWRLTWLWAKCRHPKRNSKWLRNHYWKTIGNSRWVFTHQGVRLVKPYERTIQWWKYPKVRINSSPYNPNDLKYWLNRQKN